MANAYRALGRDQEAMVGYRRFMELDPKNAQIRYEAAQILIDSGKLDEARQELTQALALEPKLAAARNALGVLALRRGDLAGAEREIRAAIAEKPDVRLAHYNLALLAEQQGDPPRAIARVPAGDRAARQQLQGRLQPRPAVRAHRRPRRGRCGAAPRQAIEMNPSFAEGHLFLAKAYLDRGQHLDEAVRWRGRGSSSIRAANTRHSAITSSQTSVAAGEDGARLSWKRRAVRRSSALNPSNRTFGESGAVTVTEWGASYQPERSILRRES